MKITIGKQLFQWEKNRKIQVTISPGEPQITYVQFYNKKDLQGPEVPLINGIAKIPDFLLEEHLPIMALACTGELGNTQVIARREFRVIKRAKPEKYEEDETEEEDIIYDGGEEL